MPVSKDLWFLRFPDGRIRRAAEPAIRDLLAAGRFPPGTRLRHSLTEEWRTVERIPEFAHITPAVSNGAAPATIASRLDGTRLHLTGVRALVEELLAALDSTFARRKIQVAAFAGLLLGLLVGLASFDLFSFAALGWLLPVVALAVWSWLGVVLSKMTYAEVSLLRPARWSDGLPDSLGATVRVALAQGLVAVILLGVIAAVRWLPGWLLGLGEDNAYFTLAAQLVTVAGMILELLVWPLLALLLPMAALFTIEQSGLFAGLRHWLSLAARMPGRLLVAETLTLGVGLLLAGPLVLLAILVWRVESPELALIVSLTRWSLAGMIAGVFLAYVIVANVFVYLHVRYDEH